MMMMRVMVVDVGKEGEEVGVAISVVASSLLLLLLLGLGSRPHHG